MRLDLRKVCLKVLTTAVNAVASLIAITNTLLTSTNSFLSSINTAIANIYTHLTTGTTTVIDNYRLHTIVDKTFSFSGTIATPNAGVDNNVLLISNPNGSGKKMAITSILFGDTVTNNLYFMRLFFNPTVTANGTLQAIRNNNIGSVATSVMTVHSIPTTSAVGNELRNAVNGRDNNSMTLDEKGKIVLNPNNTLLLTGRPSSNNRIMSLTVIWHEEA
jgi:hypothetical protein